MREQQGFQMDIYRITNHTYKARRIFSYLNYAWMIFTFVLGCILLIALIVSLIKGESVSIMSSIKNFLILSVFIPLFSLYIDFLETDVHVDERGLDLKSPIRTFHVGWEDIVEIKRARLLGLPMFNKPYIVITSSKLSIFHCLYGIIYGRTAKHSFFFSSFISNSDVLRQKIIDHIKSKRLAKQHRVMNNNHLAVTSSKSRTKRKKKLVSKK